MKKSGGWFGKAYEGSVEREHTFLIWLFHFCTPIRTFTVFCMRPEDTTTAFICLDALVAMVLVDIVRQIFSIDWKCFKVTEDFDVYGVVDVR